MDGFVDIVYVTLGLEGQEFHCLTKIMTCLDVSMCVLAY